MAPADPLDGGGRPVPGRISCPAAGGSRRPFQGRRDPAQRPAEHPAAPDQQHHLVIVLTHQLPDPLTGRQPAHSGVDLPASCRPLQRRRDPVAESNCSPTGRDCALEETSWTSKTPFSHGRPAPGQCIKSEFRDFSRQDSIPQTPPGPAPDPRRSGSAPLRVHRGATNRLRRLEDPPRAAGGAGMSPAYASLAPGHSLPGQHRRSERVFFSGSAELLAWCEAQGLERRQVTPGTAGRFIDREKT